MADHIERTVNITVGGEAGYTVDLRYDIDEPLDVQLWFDNGNVWTFPRQTLTEGMDMPATAPAGDVLVQPFDEQIVVDLIGEHTTCRIAFQRLDILLYLSDTNEICPPGAEQVDWDAELAELLDGAL